MDGRALDGAVKYNMRKSLDLEHEGCYLQAGKKDCLQECGFNATAKTIFIIHGWTVHDLKYCNLRIQWQDCSFPVSVTLGNPHLSLSEGGICVAVCFLIEGIYHVNVRDCAERGHQVRGVRMNDSCCLFSQMSGMFESWMHKLVAAVMRRETDANVVVVDWIAMAQQLYPDAVNHTQNVGLDIAAMINWLQVKKQNKTKRVYL